MSQRSGKLLISIVPKHRGELLMSVSKAAGARGGTIMSGHSVKGGALLQALALADVSRDVILTFLGPEAPAVITAIKDAGAKHPKKFHGKAIVLNMATMYKDTNDSIFEAAGTARRSGIMDTGTTLLAIIVNYGLADEAMAAARKAGATGGTIFVGRGTGTEADAKFFGITIVPEKEMLFIVADTNQVPAIQEAVLSLPDLAEPGGGVVFTMPVEDFISFGK